MIITIDCRWINSSGVGVYIRECLPFILDSCHSFLLIGNSKNLIPLVSGRENVRVLDCSVPPFSLRELLAFPGNLLEKINCGDLYYSPYFNIPGLVKIPVYTTIHDMVFPDMPELCSRPGLAVRMWFYRRAFKHSGKIFTVSEFSKSRINHYSRNSVPVIVTHSAIRPHIIKKRKSGAAKKNIILFIGNIKKHKGLKILIEAFLQAHRDGLEYKLVIVGSREKFRTSDAGFSPGSIPVESYFGKSGFGEGPIEFTGFISDEKLLELLGEASLLVQPSLYEGFGLPPLEAIVLGTQALISDIPVFKEIYHDFPVVFFRAGDACDLKDKMMEMLFNKKPPSPDLSPELLKRYTFEKTARCILENF